MNQNSRMSERPNLDGPILKQKQKLEHSTERESNHSSANYSAARSRPAARNFYNTDPPELSSSVYQDFEAAEKISKNNHTLKRDEINQHFKSG